MTLLNRTPQQAPERPIDDPGQFNPKPPGENDPSDKPRPNTDPGKQPIS